VKTVLFFNPPPEPAKVLSGLLGGLFGGQQVRRLPHCPAPPCLAGRAGCAAAASSTARAQLAGGRH
jgi:hypothetical protein